MTKTICSALYFVGSGERVAGKAPPEDSCEETNDGIGVFVVGLVLLMFAQWCVIEFT